MDGEIEVGDEQVKMVSSRMSLSVEEEAKWMGLGRSIQAIRCKSKAERRDKGGRGPRGRGGQKVSKFRLSG